MRKIIVLISFILFLFGQNIKITSKFFKYNSKDLVSFFEGDVNVTRDKDNILCDKLYVYFDKNKKAKKIEAIGNVRFKFAMDNNSTYIGHSDILIYFVKNGNIFLKGNAFIKKVETNESINGNVIKINRITKNIQVEGNNKPIQIIIKAE